MHRRTIIASASGALAGAAGFGRATVGAQADRASLADHPLTGTWLAMVNPPLPDDPQIPAPSAFGADGSVLLMFPLTQAGPRGVQFNSAYVGTWEADSERRGHFTAVQLLSGADGAFLGSVTVDGYPEVSEDGQSFVDDGSLVTVTVRDPAGVVVQQFSDAGSRPVTGIRMGVGTPGFPAGTDAATPAP